MEINTLYQGDCLELIKLRIKDVLILLILTQVKLNYMMRGCLNECNEKNNNNN